jgi:very-short-patch-repair endonuclease
MKYKHEVNKELWSVCQICNKTLEEIKRDIGGTSTYFPQAFKRHMEEEHKINITDYFYNHLKIEKRICQCEICNMPVDISWHGARMVYKNYYCGRNKGIMKWSEEAKESRKGKNNPMYSKTPWNYNLTKDDHESIKRVSEKQTGRYISEETKSKQSESAKKRLVHGHTGKKHSDETKEFLRQNTLSMINRGVFKQTKTKPHIAMSIILDELAINYEEEKILHHYSFDFYLTDYDIYIEVDGDYFHTNPNRYKDGPKTKTQKINAENDKRKDKYMESENKTLVRFWESDLLKNKEGVICCLKRLCQLNQSDIQKH